jgi:hypothetical protein
VLDPGVEEGPDHVRDLGGLADEGACRGTGSLMPRGGPHWSQAARAWLTQDVELVRDACEAAADALAG